MGTINPYSNYTLKQVTEKDIAKLFDNQPTDSGYYAFKKKLENNNDKFSAEKIAAICNNVLSSIENKDNKLSIQFAVDHLKYEHHGNAKIDEKIFIQMFKDLFKIDLKFGMADLVLEGEVPKSLFFLNSTPNFQNKPVPKNISTYLLDCYKKRADCDTVFEVKEGAIVAHKLILNQCPYFKTAHVTDGKSLALKPFSDKVVDAFFKYLYSDQLDEGSLPFYIEMLNLINHVGYEDIKPILMQQISKGIDRNDFISHALQSDDPDLKNLIQWFLVQNSEAKFDLSQYSLSSLSKFYGFVMENEVPGQWRSNILAEIGKKLELTQDFITLCENAILTKDAEMREAVVKGLKNNKELNQKLSEGKKETFKPHWKAFQAMQTDFSF